MSDSRQCPTQLPQFYVSSFFFFNDTATTEIYTLSLHDALPILDGNAQQRAGRAALAQQGDQVVLARDTVQHARVPEHRHGGQDRKSTRLNSSHSQISYAVFCLKKKKLYSFDLRRISISPLRTER